MQPPTSTTDRWHVSASALPPIVLALVTAIVAVLGFVLWSTNNIDQRALERQTTTVSHVMEGRLSRILHELASVALSEETLRRTTTEFDPRWIDQHVARWLSDFFGHDRTVVLDAANNPVYVLVEGAHVDNAAFELADPTEQGSWELEEGDEAWVAQIAGDLGLSEVHAVDKWPFGTLHNGLLSRLPVATFQAPESPDLSGDTYANDITRLPAKASIVIEGHGRLTVVSTHLKSGFDDDDELRRAVDAWRTVQAALPATERTLVAGDLNAELGETVESPSAFTSTPGGLPSTYELGADMRSKMTVGGGLPNDAFVPYDEAGLVPFEPRQRDGSDGTRWVSGRRIDYLHATPDLDDTAVGAEVFDCDDQALDGPIDFGEPAASDLCARASDHLPLVVELLFE
mgnify:CR=1 FL=1